MTVSVINPPTGANAGARIGPGLRVAVISSLAAIAGDTVQATVSYVVGGNFMAAVTSGRQPASPGTGASTNILLSQPEQTQLAGQVDGGACEVDILYQHAAGAIFDSGTVTGYTWDANSGIAGLIVAPGGASLIQTSYKNSP